MTDVSGFRAENPDDGRTFNMGGFRRMLIRCETPMDYPEIRRLVKTAFETAKVSNGEEQDFVETLRSRNVHIPELALVAEEAGVLIGHIMLTRIPFAAADGGRVGALLLAPLSVLAEYRNRRVGANLVREAMRRAALMEYDAVFLVGDPVYYRRFGFVGVVDKGIRHASEIPDEFVQVAELRPGGVREGTVSIHDA